MQGAATGGERSPESTHCPARERTSNDRGREGRHVVDHERTRRARRQRAVEALWRLGGSAHRGPSRRARLIRRDRGGDARARAHRASDRHRHAASPRCSRPAAAGGALERDALRVRHRRRSSAPDAVRLRAPQSVPARTRHDATPARPRRAADRERERHDRRRRDPLRRQRPPRGARVALVARRCPGAAHRHRWALHR